MTPGQKIGAKVVGTGLAIVVLMIIAVLMVPWLVSLLDDGHRAYPPSAYERRK